MLILSKPSVGSERVKDLVCWAKVFFSPFIPVQSQILDQSQQISNGWNGLTRAILSYSYRSLSVLIHWIPSIYAEHLKPAQRLEYLNFGHAFMSSFYNMQRSVALEHLPGPCLWGVMKTQSLILHNRWKKWSVFVTIFDGGTNRELYLVLYYILWSASAFALKVIQLHAHGFKQLFLHVCVIILIGSIYFAY